MTGILSRKASAPFSGSSNPPVGRRQLSPLEWRQATGVSTQRTDFRSDRIDRVRQSSVGRLVCLPGLVSGRLENCAA